jgi:hypothetical protein
MRLFGSTPNWWPGVRPLPDPTWKERLAAIARACGVPDAKASDIRDDERPPDHHG